MTAQVGPLLEQGHCLGWGSLSWKAPGPRLFTWGLRGVSGLGLGPGPLSSPSSLWSDGALLPGHLQEYLGLVF